MNSQISQSLITASVIVVVGVLFIVMLKFIFKKSIAFKITAIATIPLITVTIAGYILGMFGIKHILWIFPMLIPVFIGFYLWMVNIFRNPLKKMIDDIQTLAEGDVDIRLDNKIMQGDNEFSEGTRAMKSLVEAFKGMVAHATDIGHGNLDATYNLLSEKDALGNALVNMQKNLKEAKIEQDKFKKEEEQRNWISVGLAKFAEILRRDNDNLETLSHNIIISLVKYMDANQGGLFILEDDGDQPVLELKSCYAYERKKYLRKQILPGEGLVGACYREGESIYMTDIPGDYMQITSGLGGNNPRALLITPLKINDEIYGVIEIASFIPFEPYKQEFVERLGESVASAISSVRSAIRTNKLLEQSKIQAEEMANQEEELRQNMEEMQATQEEMRRREDELNDALINMKEMLASAEDIQTKSEYSKKEVEKLVINISKMAKGDFNCDFSVEQPNEYTLEEYNHFCAIASNLEQVCHSMKNILSENNN